MRTALTISTRGLLLCILLNPSLARVQSDTQAGPLPAATLAFIDVNLVPMDSERVVPHQTVVVRARQIAAIGPVAVTAVPPQAVRVEGRGSLFLMPGLADMHTHADEPDDFYWYVANGVTTILNMGGESPSLRPHIEAGDVVGPWIFSSFFMDGPGNAPGPVFTEHNAREGVRRGKAEGYEFIKVYNSLSREPSTALLTKRIARDLPSWATAFAQLD
jgi:hypothetical protein